MEYVYKKDKCLALSYIATEKQCSLSYRKKTEESRRSCAAKRKEQRLCSFVRDITAEFGPPDKRENFNGTKATSTKRTKDTDHDSDFEIDVLPKKKATCTSFSGIGQRVEVKYDDGVWYKGTLVNFNVTSGSGWLTLMMTMKKHLSSFLIRMYASSDQPYMYTRQLYLPHLPSLFIIHRFHVCDL